MGSPATAARESMAAAARPVGGLVHVLAVLAIVALVGCASFFSLFRPLDNWLLDQRFSAASRTPTGSIVFVEIDPASLRHVGVWPWPRHIYAQLLDRLMAMGAQETVLDIDFSSASSETEDQALEAAIERAGGYALLAGFRQLSPVTGQLEVTLPLPRFRAAADTVMVNAMAEPDGIVRRYPSGLELGGKYYPSLADALSGAPLAPGNRVFLDYGIDASAIDRIAVADVLTGKVDPARIAGRQVVVGASAQELRDIFTVPRYGTVPGAFLQIIAAETLKQHRALRTGGRAVPLAMVMAVGLVLLLLRGRVPLWGEAATALFIALAVEGSALALQVDAAFLLRTAPVDVVLLGLLACAVLQELETKRRLHAEAERQRDATRDMLDQVIADSFDGVMVIDEAGSIVAASRMAERLLAEGAPLVGRDAAAFLPDGINAAVSHQLAAFAAEAPLPAIPSEATLPLLGDRRTLEYVVTGSEIATAGGLRRVVCLSFRDITERRQSMERLAFLAAHDHLTGARSRLAFVEAIEVALGSDADRDQGLTIAIIDLGRLQIVNDLFGHDCGDLVLREAAARLISLDLLAVGRVGGNRFALARRGRLAPPEARQFGQLLVGTVGGSYQIGDRRAVLSAHAGVTSTDISGFDGGVLLSHADMALAGAKAMPGNPAEVFVTAMTLRLAEKQELEAALRQAIAEGQLQVHYQPQVHLRTGALVGVEALLRWHHAELGEVSPSRFIPVAEEAGLILELGRFVLRTACRDAASWPGSVRIAVNVSPVQFELGDMVAEVGAALALADLGPERLEVEITEGLFVGHGHPANLALERLRLMGVKVALDDFGTGYSSLSYLARLPLDKLKIDRSFVRDLPHDHDARAVVGTILTLARTLGKGTIAEGIETESQATLLAAGGCEVGQGYLFGKPMPAKEFCARFLVDRPLATAMAG
ncbi:MAG TPA: EAL domain-containing protein [Devosiaceae bacterium]|nr:EAL domain-containing protein [Devosiaceae bacterium]